MDTAGSSSLVAGKGAGKGQRVCKGRAHRMLQVVWALATQRSPLFQGAGVMDGKEVGMASLRAPSGARTKTLPA